MSELSALIANLQVTMRPHAASPVSARRKDTDQATGRANGTVTDGYGKANSLSSRDRGGTYPNTYRPTAKDFAGMTPATTRPAYGSVKPAGGIRLGDDRSLEAARAMGEDNGYRAWAAARTNLVRDAGDVTSPMYPTGRTRAGNLAPSARY